MPQHATSSSSRATSNDVFFHRKAEGSDAAVVATPKAEQPPSAELPEISEISEIPEFREAATAPEVQAPLEVPAQVKVEPSAALEAAVPAAPVSIIAEVVASLNKAAVEAPAREDAAKKSVKDEPASGTAASQGADELEREAHPANGFFKRLFGK